MQSADVINESLEEETETLAPASKTLPTLQQGINPLTAAAAPLMAILQHLRTATLCENLPKLHDQLIAELKGFEESARTRSYSDKDIFLARYILCATLDDIIYQSPWDQKHFWVENSLLSSYLHEPAYSDRFVIIIQRALQEADHYLDLLELAYLCISLGFKGVHTAQEIPADQLRLLAAEVYFAISHRRQHLKTQPLALLSSHHSAAMTLQQNKKQQHELRNISLLTATILVLLYLALSYFLNYSNQTMSDDFKQIQRFLEQHSEEI